MYLIEKDPIAKILEIAKHKETNTNIIIYGFKGDPWIFKPFVRDQLAPSVPTRYPTKRIKHNQVVDRLEQGIVQKRIWWARD